MQLATAERRTPSGTQTGEVTISIGGIHGSAQPTVVRTLLGSCIAVCLWDPTTRIGGMNHFLLPDGTSGDPRFGVHAMDRLIGVLMRLGARREHFVAKVFGGAHVLPDASPSVPEGNIAFVRTFLAEDGLRILTQDVGGTSPRIVRFHTDSGRAFVKRVASAHATAQLERHETRHGGTRPAFGSVTLF